MKKYVILIIFFTALFKINVDIHAAAWSYKWENTTIEIPLGASINDYYLKPKASLYKDNVLLEDAEINIISEGDWMYYLSDVNTKRVGTYEVWYKAFETEKYRPGTCNGYKCKVSFIVYDDIKPEISVLEETITLRLNSEFDPLINVIAKDNYDEDLTIDYITNLDLQKNGEYIVNVYAIDSSNNKAETSYKVIVNSNPPIIKYNHKEINIPLNGAIDIKAYFEAYDEILGDVTSYLEYGEYDEENEILKPIDTTTIGKKLLTVRLMIQNHIIMKQYEANIIDDVAPIMSFNQRDINEGITLDYNYGYENYDFLKHVSITDNVEIDYNNLTFNTNCEKKVGTYTVWYYYNDSKFNVTGSLVVHLISYDPPVIEVSDITTYVYEQIEYENYIKIIDESDPNILSRMKIFSDNVDMATPGIYYAEVYVINSSGRDAEEKIRVEILALEEENNSVSADSSDSNSSTEKSNTSIFSSNVIKDLKSDSIYLIIITILVGLIVFFLYKLKRKKITN